jgi:hypothetical protein
MPPAIIEVEEGSIGLALTAFHDANILFPDLPNPNSTSKAKAIASLQPNDFPRLRALSHTSPDFEWSPPAPAYHYTWSDNYSMEDPDWRKISATDSRSVTAAMVCDTSGTTTFDGYAQAQASSYIKFGGILPNGPQDPPPGGD